ncbi:MAG: hypothetical protein QM622_03315, partial [Microbacterium sp.]
MTTDTSSAPDADGFPAGRPPASAVRTGDSARTGRSAADHPVSGGSPVLGDGMPPGSVAGLSRRGLLGLAAGIGAAGLALGAGAGSVAGVAVGRARAAGA